ncbi:MAG: DUF4382 domain-containing protein [Halanaerobium sp.]|nr:DUF4382 domain-containing protein [Halanaerobium sp.]
MKRTLVVVLMLGALLVFSGCGGLNQSDTAEVALYLADAPVNDVAYIYVTLERVDVVRLVDGEQVVETIKEFDITNEKESKFDLLALRFDEALLGQATLPPGTYKQIRLVVAADTEKGENPKDSGLSYIEYKPETGKEPENIFIPSGQQTGLKINHEFTIEAGELRELVLDNDVSQLLNAAGQSGLIILRPTAIRVVDRLMTGDIIGKVLKSSDDTIITETDVTVKAVDPDSGLYIQDDNGNDIQTLVNPEDGMFKLRGLETGNYNIEISAEGYVISLVPAEVVAGQNTDIGVIRLEAEATEPETPTV